MTAHRCAGGLKKKLNHMVGLPCHRHLVGIHPCPSKHRHRANIYTFILRNSPFQSPFTTRMGKQWEHVLVLNPSVHKGANLVMTHILKLWRLTWMQTSSEKKDTYTLHQITRRKFKSIDYDAKLVRQQKCKLRRLTTMQTSLENKNAHFV